MFYNSDWTEELTPVAKFLLEQRENSQIKIPHPIFSNRARNCICTLDTEVAKRGEVIVDPGRIGVDKLVIEVPLYGRESDPKEFLASLRNSEIGKWGRTATVRLDAASNSTAFVQWLKNRWSVSIEFNPSRLFDPDGFSLVPVEGLPRIVERLIRDLFEYAGSALPYFAVDDEGQPSWEKWDENWMSQILITRLDATRDFDIPDERFHVDLYRDIRPRSAKATRITYGAGGIPELWEGVYASRFGSVKFYNKYRKAKKDDLMNLPPVGYHRFEFCAGRYQLEHFHIHDLSMLTPDRFDILLKGAWRKSKLYAQKSFSGAWANKLIQGIPDPLQALACVGMLFCRDNQVETNLPKSLERNLKKLVSENAFDFRRSLDSHARERIKLNFQDGKLMHFDW